METVNPVVSDPINDARQPDPEEQFSGSTGDGSSHVETIEAHAKVEGDCVVIRIPRTLDLARHVKKSSSGKSDVATARAEDARGLEFYVKGTRHTYVCPAGAMNINLTFSRPKTGPRKTLAAK